MSDRRCVMNRGPYDETLLRLFRVVGVVLPLLMIWNGVADTVYGYSPTLSGMGYYTMKVWNVVRTAGGRPHWAVMMAQTAGWLYPVYALTYYLWWIGMRKAGFWTGTFPNLLMVYALLMIGGTQHADWAYLSVLSQAQSVVGSGDPTFYGAASRFIVEHFFWGDATALLAFFVGSYWHAVSILRGNTLFPRWFVLFSPGGILTIIMIVGAFVPAPAAGMVLAPFGTWYMLVPTVAKTVWLWNRVERREVGEATHG